MKNRKLIGICLTLIVMIMLTASLCACVGEQITDDGNETAYVTLMDGDEVFRESYDASKVLRFTPTTKTGYDFVGWFVDKEMTIPLEKTPEDGSIVYGKWKIKTFTVTFYAGEEILKIQTVEYGGAADAPAVDKEGYDLAGWNRAFDNVTADIKVYATFTPKKYTLTFYDFTGAAIEVYDAVETGEGISDMFLSAQNKLVVPEGFLFDGWYDREDETKTPVDATSAVMKGENTGFVAKIRIDDSPVGAEICLNFTNIPYDADKGIVANLSAAAFEIQGITYKYEWFVRNVNTQEEYGSLGVFERKYEQNDDGDYVYVWYKNGEKDKIIPVENDGNHYLPRVGIDCPDVGNYKFKVRVVLSAEEYGLETYKEIESGKNIDISITPLTITDASVYDTEYVYADGKAHLPGVNCLEGDVILYGAGATGDFSTTAPTFDNAGKYSVFVKISRKNHIDKVIGEAKVTVRKAVVDIKVSAPDISVFYGERLPTLNWIPVNFTGDVSEISGEINYMNYVLTQGEITIRQNAIRTGEFAVKKVSGLTSDNYEFRYITETDEGNQLTLTVNKAPLTVTLPSRGIFYGDDFPSDVAAIIEGLRFSDEATAEISTDYRKGDAVDNYAITASVTASENYSVTVKDGTLTVSPREITVTINDVADLTYGDPCPEFAITAEGLYGSDTLNVSYVTNYNRYDKVGGLYSVSATLNGLSDNYILSGEIESKTFKVAHKRALNISLTTRAALKNGKFSATADKLKITGLQGSDKVNGVVSLNVNTEGTHDNIGDFDLSGLSVTNADCYDIGYSFSVTLVNVQFDVFFSDETVVYDGLYHSVFVSAGEGADYTITYKTDGGDFTTTIPEFINAGSYVVYFNLHDNGGLLSDEQGQINLTISKAPLTVAANDVTITFGDAFEKSYNARGFVSGDEGADLGTAQYQIDGYGAGTHEIKISGLSHENYDITFVPGVLTVNKKQATLTWGGLTGHVYDGTSQTVTAVFTDVNGNEASATVVFRKDGVACEFINAGQYVAYAADEDGNYEFTNGVSSVGMAKADYADVSYGKTIAITYDPAQRLSDVALDAGYRWKNLSETPVCNKGAYEAIYNADPENYNDYPLSVTVGVNKAETSISSNIFEFVYDGNAHEIRPVVIYKGNELSDDYYTLTFDVNSFTAAGTYKSVVAMTSDNYRLADGVCYVKVKGVKIGESYYTIEDALFNAKSGNVIIVTTDTAFAEKSIADVLYNDNAYRTVKTGVTLLVPFSETDVKGHVGGGEDGSENYGAHPASNGTPTLYRTLTVPEGTNITVYGSFIVGALTGSRQAGTGQNRISGGYSEVILNGNIVLNNAALEVYGYIKGSGEITANNSTVIENLYLSGWMGGTISSARYVGNDKILGTTVAFGGSFSVDNPTQFPFSQYELRSIRVTLTINKGSTLKGYAKIATSAQEKMGITVPAQINEAYIVFVSSDGSDASSGLLRIAGDNGKIVKTFSDDRVGLRLYGSVKDGYTSIKVAVFKCEITMSSEKVFFPIDGRIDITLENGATFTQDYSFKFMPGATLTVKEGATYNLNGQTIMYDHTFTDISTCPYPGAARGDAVITVNGTMNINGAFGGNILSSGGGVVNTGASATLTGITSKEGTGSNSTSGIYVVVTYEEVCSVTKAVTLSGVQAEKGKTYRYDATTSAWTAQ